MTGPDVVHTQQLNTLPAGAAAAWGCAQTALTGRQTWPAAPTASTQWVRHRRWRPGSALHTQCTDQRCVLGDYMHNTPGLELTASQHVSILQYSVTVFTASVVCTCHDGHQARCRPLPRAARLPQQHAAGDPRGSHTPLHHRQPHEGAQRCQSTPRTGHYLMRTPMSALAWCMTIYSLLTTQAQLGQQLLQLVHSCTAVSAVASHDSDGGGYARQVRYCGMPWDQPGIIRHVTCVGLQASGLCQEGACDGAHMWNSAAAAARSGFQRSAARWSSRCPARH